MNAPDLFGYFWLTGVAVFAAVSVAWGINDLKSGSARLGTWGSRVSREEEPFEFWLAVGGKLAALPVGIFMFWFGLDMLK